MAIGNHMRLGISKARLILVVGLTVVALFLVWLLYSMPSREQRRQHIGDGSELVLTRYRYGRTNSFTHGTGLEKLFGGWIPAKGFHVGRLQLQRPKPEPVFSDDRPQLIAEFKLVTNPTNAPNHPLVRLGHPQYRFVVSGGDDFEYGQLLWPNRFTQYRDGYFGYVLCSSFPRDSKRLNIWLEQSDTYAGPWHKVSRFIIRNPTCSANLAWKPQPQSVLTNGMRFELGEVKVASTNDIWDNRRVALGFRVWTNGLLLTNWTTARTFGEDATGNWDLGAKGLDPRSVWKLEVDFSPESGYPPESMLTFQVPVRLTQPMETNLLRVPLEINWINQDMLAVQMLTNTSSLRLIFVEAHDRSGRDLNRESGNWGQYHFWRALDLSQAGNSIEATIAIVPNVHVTYFVMPTLIGQ